MNHQHRLQLANRIHLQLTRDLGHGIDVQRLLADVRYARDVLLVCDALPQSDLPALSAQFRQAEPSEAAAPAAVWVKDRGRFAPSQPARDSQLDIDLSDFDPPPAAAKPGPWRLAARWFGGR